jgi:hypothetical protein
MLTRIAIVFALAAATGLSPAALAAESSFMGGSSSPSVGAPVATSRGFGVVTGTIGSTGITSLPGSGGQGFLMNNGNGTSTLIVPGGTPQVISTPK